MAGRLLVLFFSAVKLPDLFAAGGWRAWVVGPGIAAAAVLSIIELVTALWFLIRLRLERRGRRNPRSTITEND